MYYISIARTGNVMMYALGSYSGKQFPYDGRLNADTELSLFVCKQPLGGGGSVVIHLVAIATIGRRGGVSGHTPSGHSIKSFHWFFLALKQSKNYYLYHAFKNTSE